MNLELISVAAAMCITCKRETEEIRSVERKISSIETLRITFFMFKVVKVYGLAIKLQRKTEKKKAAQLYRLVIKTELE